MGCCVWSGGEWTAVRWMNDRCTGSSDTMTMKGAWQYYENRKNGEAFTKEEQSKWNEEKKKSAKKS